MKRLFDFQQYVNDPEDFEENFSLPYLPPWELEILFSDYQKLEKRSFGCYGRLGF